MVGRRSNLAWRPIKPHWPRKQTSPNAICQKRNWRARLSAAFCLHPGAKSATGQRRRQVWSSNRRSKRWRESGRASPNGKLGVVVPDGRHISARGLQPGLSSPSAAMAQGFNLAPARVRYRGVYVALWLIFDRQSFCEWNTARGMN